MMIIYLEFFSRYSLFRGKRDCLTNTESGVKKKLTLKVGPGVQPGPGQASLSSSAACSVDPFKPAPEELAVATPHFPHYLPSPNSW